MPRTLHIMRTSVNARSRESAHSAPQVGGILCGMAAKIPSTAPRGVRIPIDKESWWPTAARAAADKRAKEKGLRPPGVRDLTAEICAMGVDTDEDAVGRCLRGEIVTWEIAKPMSTILGIPPPAHMPTSLAEAEVFATLLEKLKNLR